MGAAEEGEIFQGLPEGRAEARWEELRLPGDSSCGEEQRGLSKAEAGLGRAGTGSPGELWVPGRGGEPRCLLPQFPHLWNGKMLLPPLPSPLWSLERRAEMKPSRHLGPLGGEH